MAAKPGQLRARWSKRERDVLFEWGGDGAGKCDGSWLSSWLTWHKGFDGTFLDELKQRGFDPATLKISVMKSGGAGP